MMSCRQEIIQQTPTAITNDFKTRIGLYILEGSLTFTFDLLEDAAHPDSFIQTHGLNRCCAHGFVP